MTRSFHLWVDISARGMDRISDYPNIRPPNIPELCFASLDIWQKRDTGCFDKFRSDTGYTKKTKYPAIPSFSRLD